MHGDGLLTQVTKTRADGTVEEEEQKVWNDTIANLSLMALGSSAPEILLSVIGVVTALGEEADGTSPKHGLLLRAGANLKAASPGTREYSMPNPWS